MVFFGLICAGMMTLSAAKLLSRSLTLVLAVTVCSTYFTLLSAREESSVSLLAIMAMP